MELSCFSYTERDLSRMPKRPAESHKGTFGKVLCVCGSDGMCGAAYFASKACYRMGAGLVRILTTTKNQPILQALIPEAIVTAYDLTRPYIAQEAIAWADVLVVGCGMGISAESRGLLSDLLRARGEKPTVLDADALNLLSRNPSLMKHTKGAIVTPHVGEMSRLTSLSCEEISQNAVKIAHDFASKHELICVLKSHRTVVSDTSELVYRNTSGNSGMATGGSGDVLAGIIGGILAQSRNSNLTAMDAACLGVYLHGLCGDAAAEKLTEYSVMASDLLDAIPTIFRRYFPLDTQMLRY